MGRLTKWLGWEPEVSLERRAIYYATDGRDTLFNDPDGWEVGKPWLWWSGASDTEGVQSGPWGNPLPGANSRAPGWSLPAVTRCTNLVASTLAGLPIRVQRGTEALPVPSWITDPQMLRPDGRAGMTDLLPDVRFSNVVFYSQWITSALWHGDGFIYAPVRDSAGQPVPPMWLLHPAYVVVKSPIDAPRYSQPTMQYFIRSEDGDVPLDSKSILHLRGNAPYWDGRGTGVIDAHGPELGLAMAVRRWAGSQFSAGVPAGFLKVTSPNLTQDKADSLKSAWMNAHGTGRRSIAVLNATTEFTPIAISPLDAQLDKAREWSLRDVALAFGVPAWFLGIPGDSSTYSNVESRFIELRTYTLLPWIRRIEAVLDAQFPAGTSTKIVTAGLERGDTSTRYQNYKLAIEMGLMTVDEARALEDLPPLNGADSATLAEEMNA
jgi:HK97 family phage portal protein